MSEMYRILSEKMARVKAAISLEAHDRVPLVATTLYWPVVLSKKHTMQEAFYSIDVLAECQRGFFSEWNDWDAFNANLHSFAPMLDATGSRRYSVPGRDISPQVEFQHPDVTLMGPDEYGKLAKDPTRFMMEEIVPRLCTRIGSDDSYVRSAALAKAALFYAQSQEKSRHYGSLSTEYGVPRLYHGSSFTVPMDFIADKLRGFQQGLMDIKQRPAEVAAACEALVPFILSDLLSSVPFAKDYPLIFNPQHVSPFISPKDYDRVYWPTFKKIVDELVARGIRVWVFFEGNQEQHLERLQDLPKGKIVAHLESTDLGKARKALGGKICVAGGMSSRLLARGTPAEIRNRTAEALRIFEGEPGFIMTSDTGIPANAKPENVRAWIDAVKEFGRLGGTPNGVESRLPLESKVKTRAYELPPVTSWEDVRAEFGPIKGDEKIIKENWEQLELSLVRFIRYLLQ